MFCLKNGLQDENFIIEAINHAYLSPDPSTKNAALIVNEDGEILVKEVNRFPNRLHYTQERLQNPLKKSCMQHAEAGAIYAAWRQGIDLRNCALYTIWYACEECAKVIIASEITTVVGLETSIFDDSSWKPSVDIGIQRLRDAGIFTRRYQLSPCLTKDLRVIHHGKYYDL